LLYCPGRNPLTPVSEKAAPPLTKGFYTNYVDSDVTMAGYRDNYGANFERLVALKAKYDPKNLFRLNANVPPKIG